MEDIEGEKASAKGGGKGAHDGDGMDEAFIEDA